MSTMIKVKRVPSAALVEEILAARPIVGGRYVKHDVTHAAPGLLELHLCAVAMGLDDDAQRNARWARWARRIEACGGSWSEVRGNARTRFVSLPVPFTSESRQVYLGLLETYGWRSVVVVARLGRRDTDDVWKLPALDTDRSPERLAQLHRIWLRYADRADGEVRGIWQAAREREYEAAHQSDRARLGRLERERAQVLAHLAQIDQALADERARLATLPAAIRRAIEESSARAMTERASRDAAEAA